MEHLASHVVLAEGDDAESCRNQVLQFFNRTTLVCYDKILVADRSVTASDKEFTGELAQAVKRNRQTLQRFVDELGTTGFEHRSDLMRLDQGYNSKVLHIIAHFLDGFVGIDSAFYNLAEDSHWVSEETEKRIAQQPGRYRLLFLECYSLTPKDASLLHR